MKPFHITKNIKCAAAFATLGAELLDVDQIERDGKRELVFTFSDAAHGITCDKASALWEGRATKKLEDMVDGIIAERGVTPEEYALVALDASRAALGNRGVLLKTGMQKSPQVTRTIAGRQVIFREGTPKDAIRRHLNS